MNYSTSEKDMLAIVRAARHFRSYIFGRRVVFRTDHKPLSTLIKAKEPNGRLYRLLIKLQDLDYEIIYHPGCKNNLADLLSRPTAEVNSLEIEVLFDWASEQDKDKELATVKIMTQSDVCKIDWKELKFYEFWKKNKEYLVVGMTF